MSPLNTRVKNCKDRASTSKEEKRLKEAHKLPHIRTIKIATYLCGLSPQELMRLR